MSEPLKTILGYVVFFAYMGFLIVIGETIQKKYNLDKELTRKLEHIATGACWIIGYFLLGWTIHLFIVNLLGLIVLSIITFGGLMKSVEREDADKSYGLVYFALATLVVVAIVVFVDKSLFPYYGIAYYCLVLADGLAPIVAKAFKNHRVKLLFGKSLAGTGTVFVMTAVIATVFNFIFAMGLTPLLIFSLASLVAMAELFGAKGTDNLTIVFCAFGYLVLAHFGLLTVGVQYVILLAPIFTLSSIRLKALTAGGQLVAYLCLILFAFFGGYQMVSTLIALFVAAAIVSKITTKRFVEKTGMTKEKSARGAMQIFANSSIAAVFAVLGYFTHVGWLHLVAYTVIIEEFGDSMASDIGRLSDKPPVDILRRERIPAGTSGGVSLFGSLAALIACFLASLAPLIVYRDAILYLVIAGVAFLGVFMDSMLGSAIQARYRCESCGAITDESEHCGAPASKIKGFRFVTNSMVNILSGALTALVACLLFAFTPIG